MREISFTGDTLLHFKGSNEFEEEVSQVLSGDMDLDYEL